MTLDGTGKAIGPCPIGTCNPIDICDRCRMTIRVYGRQSWHLIRAVALAGVAPDHDPVPVVECVACGTLAEPVGPDELAEAWGDMLAARPVEGQTSWLG